MKMTPLAQPELDQDDPEQFEAILASAGDLEARFDPSEGRLRIIDLEEEVQLDRRPILMVVITQTSVTYYQ